MSRQDAKFDIKIPGSSRGLPDREFKVTVSQGKGITVRCAGSSSSRTMPWRTFLAQCLLAWGEIPNNQSERE